MAPHRQDYCSCIQEEDLGSDWAIPKEQEGKRQRSEPTTPISSSSTLPHEYDEVMGITQVDPREAERFEEGLDPEYHDATENPQDIEKPDPAHMPCFFPTGVLLVHHYVNA